MESSEYDLLTNDQLAEILGAAGESPFASATPEPSPYEERWSSALAEAQRVLCAAPPRVRRILNRLSHEDASEEPALACLAPMMLYAAHRISNTREQTLAGLCLTLRADTNDQAVVAESGDVAPDSALYTFMDYLITVSEQGVSAPDRLFRSVLERTDSTAVFTAIMAVLGHESGAVTSVPPHSQSVLNVSVPVTTFTGRSVEEVLGSLDALEGLAAPKRMAHEFVALERLHRARSKAGMPTKAHSRHMAFVGNPGTGKTEVARIVAELIGAISGDRHVPFVEADRSMLVGEFLGTSALKTRQVAEAASGGVLFIDEAYSLAANAQSGPDRFAQEALDTLVKIMEDEREDLTVIFAGYPEPMERLVGSNPGLASRISRIVEFPDYDDASLERIFIKLAEDRFCVVSDEALVALRVMTARLRTSGSFGNARAMRTILEKSIATMASRLIGEGSIVEADVSELMTIRFSDISATKGPPDDST